MPQPNNNNIVIVIPVFNEAATIRNVVSKTLQHANTIIVVDDGSDDDTLKQIEDLPITILCNELNRGKDASLMRGFAFAEQYDIAGIICLDGDNQHNPDELPKFFRCIKDYPNHIILGARSTNHLLQRMADFFISWAANQTIIDSQSSYRYYPYAFLKRYTYKVKRDGHFTFESASLIDAPHMGFPVISISVQCLYPEDRCRNHFRPFSDSIKISGTIFSKIIKRGFCLPGLLKQLFFKKTTLIDYKPNA